MTIHTGTTEGYHWCPIVGCRHQMPNSKLMCPRHWFMVPKHLQRAVYAAYSDGDGLGSLELVRAQSAAIDAVNERLGQ